MERCDMRRLLKCLENGMQFKIVFRDSISVLRKLPDSYLLAIDTVVKMEAEGMLEIEVEGGILSLVSAHTLKMWGSDNPEDRSFTLKITDKFDPDRFDPLVLAGLIELEIL